MSYAVSVNLVRLAFAAGFFGLYVWSEHPVLALIGMAGGTNLSLRAFMACLARSRFGAFGPPRYAHKELATGVGAVVSVAAVLPRVESLFWKTALVLIAVHAIVRGTKTVVLTLQSVVALGALRSDLRRGTLPRLRLPHVLIVGRGPLSDRILSAWLAQLGRTLWSTRPQGQDTPTPVLDSDNLGQGWTRVATAVRHMTGLMTHLWFSARSLVAFVTLEDVERLDEVTRDYAVQSAVATLACHTRGPLWLAVNDITADEAHRYQEAAKELVARSALLRTLAMIGKPETLDASSEARLDSLLHHATGPVVLLDPEYGPILELTDDETRERLRGYEVVTTRADQVAMATPQVIDTIANVALPLARSDRRLDATARALIPRIAAEGLAPISDVYLRFRLATSAVERFLCLFDCFEAIIKYSVLSIMPCDDPALIAALKRPSLGTWTGILRERLGERSLQRSELVNNLADFWLGPLAVKPRDLIDVVNGAGLAWRDKVPRSHLNWLDWLVWLRNSTKGHGGVEERVCQPIWHQFHATLLDTVKQTASLVLESELLAEDGNGGLTAMRGWVRGPFRSSTLTTDSGPRTLDTVKAELRHGGLRIAVAPFVLFEGNNCLTWNSGNATLADYIDYSTGRLVRRKVTIGTVSPQGG